MKFIKGNLLEAKTQALVNTVNTVGIMGKGIALQFKEIFPENYKAYLVMCKNNELKPGKLLVVKEHLVNEDKIIINFPTKTEWYRKSKYEYIEEGLKELVNVIFDNDIKSIAIPPLGCGNGGLEWKRVKSLIEKYLSDLEDVDIQIYEPNDNIRELLKKQELQKEIKLTPARAMLLYSMFYYESLGENSSLFVANKLSYFLKRLGEKSFRRVSFTASHYGPYSVQIEHMLHLVNGKYIRGLEQMNVKPFETIELQYGRAKEISEFVKNKLSSEQNRILKNLIKLIDGFQSAFALEILATVDFVCKDIPNAKKDDIIEKIKNWSYRKQELFEEKYINIALKHLDEYKSQLKFV
jgi:O-acetyl-ADP-ribose deacetylase (regulator of RNase III)